MVLDGRVAKRRLERRGRARGKGYVIGAPVDGTTVWEQRNRNKAAAALYQELASKLKIEIFENERSHVWRTTLNTICQGQVPDTVRSSQFGHTTEVNARHYTDPSDLSSLANAAKLRAVDSPQDPSHPGMLFETLAVSGSAWALQDELVSVQPPTGAARPSVRRSRRWSPGNGF